MVDTNSNSAVVHSLNPFDPAEQWEDPLGHGVVSELECPMRIHNVDAERRMVYDARYLLTWVKKNPRATMTPALLSLRDLRVVRCTGARSLDEEEEFERRAQAAALLFLRLLLQKGDNEHAWRVLRDLNVDVLSTGFVGYKRQRSYASLLCYIAQKKLTSTTAMRNLIKEIKDLDLARWNGIGDRTAEAYCTVRLLLRGRRRTLLQELAVQGRSGHLSEIVHHGKLLEEALVRRSGGAAAAAAAAAANNNNSDDSDHHNNHQDEQQQAWLAGGPMERMSRQVDDEGRNLVVLVLQEACAASRQCDSVPTVELLLRALRVPCGAFRIPGPEAFWSVSTLYEALRLHVHVALLAVVCEHAPPALLRQRDGDETERPLTVAVRVGNRLAVRYLLRLGIPITNESFLMAAELDRADLLWLMVHAYPSSDHANSHQSSYLSRWKADTYMRHALQVVEWPEANPPPEERPTDEDGVAHVRALWPQTALTVAVRHRAWHAVAALQRLELDPTSAWMTAVASSGSDQSAAMRVMRRSLLAAIVAHIVRRCAATDDDNNTKDRGSGDAGRFQLTTEWQTLSYRDTPLTLAIAHCLDAARRLAEVVPVRLLNMTVPRTVVVTYVPRNKQTKNTMTMKDDINNSANNDIKNQRKRPQAVKRTALDLLLLAIKDLDEEEAERAGNDAMLRRGTMAELQRLLVHRGAMTYDDLVLASPSSSSRAPPKKKRSAGAGAGVGVGGAAGATTKKPKKAGPPPPKKPRTNALLLIQVHNNNNQQQEDDEEDDDDHNNATSTEDEDEDDEGATTTDLVSPA